MPQRKHKPTSLRSAALFAAPAILLLYLTLQRAAIPTPQPVLPMESNDDPVSGHIPLAVPVAVPDHPARRFCDGATKEAPCIFDIGLNSGQDTAGYLTDGKARVVAVEANPTLVAAAQHKFEKEIGKRRLLVVHAGLTAVRKQGAPPAPPITFWVNTANDKFGSFLENLGCRTASGALVEQGDHSHCRRMDITPKSCLDLLREYGTPTYMKIDIEGMDRQCLFALKNVERQDRPTYVSVENVFAWDVDTLARLGYTRFKIVNQAVLEAEAAAVASDRRGNSGPWGEDARDSYLGTGWHTQDQLKARLPLPKTVAVNGREWKAWYDLHAAL